MTYSITISIDDATVNELRSAASQLVVVSGVQAAGSGVPLVWSTSQEIESNMELNWRDSFAAYISSSPIEEGVEIEASSSYPVEPGQSLIVGPDGSGNVVGSGAPGAITISSQAQSQCTCGISRSGPDGRVAPVCAYPLYPEINESISPAGQILLMFAPADGQAGVVIEQAPSPGLLLDMGASAFQNVSYGDSGWSGGDGARGVSTGESLVSLLT